MIILRYEYLHGGLPLLRGYERTHSFCTFSLQPLQERSSRFRLGTEDLHLYPQFIIQDVPFVHILQLTHSASTSLAPGILHSLLQGYPRHSIISLLDDSTSNSPFIPHPNSRFYSGTFVLFIYSPRSERSSSRRFPFIAPMLPMLPSSTLL